jgi:hypothetical protein
MLRVAGVSGRCSVTTSPVARISSTDAGATPGARDRERIESDDPHAEGAPRRTTALPKARANDDAEGAAGEIVDAV